jgi:hypothetical protein
MWEMRRPSDITCRAWASKVKRAVLKSAPEGDFDALVDSIATEKFIRSLPRDTAVFVRNSDPENLEEAADTAIQFCGGRCPIQQEVPSCPKWWTEADTAGVSTQAIPQSATIREGEWKWTNPRTPTRGRPDKNCKSKGHKWRQEEHPREKTTDMPQLWWSRSLPAFTTKRSQ